MDLQEGEKWWGKETVAVVTGANRGIGVETVRSLAHHGIIVVLTARKDEQNLSQEARDLLHQPTYNVLFHPLDVQSDHSVSTFARWLDKQLGGLDILINNAAVGGVEYDWDLLHEHNVDFRKIAEEESSHEGVRETYETAKECVDINYYGMKRTTKALLPLFKASAAGPRIVNVSSFFGLLRFLRSESLQKRLLEMEKLGEEDIESIIGQFLEDVRGGYEAKESIWPLRFPSYSVSKMAMNAYTRVMGAEMEGRVWVNCVHPGYVKTEMTFNSGDISAEEGAENVVRVALLPPGGPSAQFFLEKQKIDFF